ncbi:MAG: hypothetical protein KJ734_07455, partial [Chloroflexi bacterium]|nr:hypothetical protein [Chloroflexota bacterium]
RFGVAYQDGHLPDDPARAEGSHALVAGVDRFELIDGNGVPFDLTEGRILARAGEALVAALVDHGQGQVLVLADVGLLGAAGDPGNLSFWLNLAEYARSR